MKARKQNEDALDAAITEWTSIRSPGEVQEHLQKAGVTVFACATNKDIAEDPHLAQRGYFVELPHPEVGTKRHIGIPWRMSATPCQVKAPAPTMGQHNNEVLTSVLGYTLEQVEKFREAGALT